MAQLSTADIPKAPLTKIITPENAETSLTEYTQLGSPALTLPPGTFAGRAVKTQDQTAQLAQEIIT